MQKLKIINMFMKISLTGLLMHAIWFSDLPQYKDKAIALRVVFYPLAAALTYIIWKIAQKRTSKRLDYPYAVDECLTFVVAFDLLGNTIAFYDKITWWDDIMHLLLSIPWVIVVGYLLRNKGLTRWVTAGLVVAYGSTSHIIWELLEYLSFVRSNPTESLTAYRDTMGDLTLSTIGTLIGAFITAKYLWTRINERKRTY
jgi:glycopeptide antibiotics resistance protein